MAAEELDRYALADRLFALLADELTAEGLELVDVRIFRGGGRLQVRLYVDAPGEERIDLDGCMRASRSAGMVLEAADPIAGPYVLEVSSPGVRRPLRTDAHLAEAVGRPVELRVRGDGKPRRLRGRLDAWDGEALLVAPLEAGGDPIADEATDGEPEPAAVGDESAATPSPPVARRYGTPTPIRRRDVLEANLDEDLDVQALINADRRRHKEEKRQLREERKAKPRGRVRPKPHRET